MLYRSEIDGLRALAVLPVMLFHAGFALFSGGFVGVDVFFVISGYLITGIIIEDIEKGTFSIRKFYERRARRILPALLLVVIVSICVAFFTLGLHAMEQFGKSVFATIFFVSNFFFWSRSGYFDIQAELLPLLHTWSIAVEEQFYIFFPPILMLAWRFRKNMVLILLSAIFLISLALSHWSAYNAPQAGFFLIHTRIWELLAGSFTAFFLRDCAFHPSRSVKQIASILGLFFILLGIFIYDKSTPFPGLYALLPVCGTVLIIVFADKSTIVHYLLSMKIPVFIGLISYSAYLWHQPMFAFFRYAYPFDLPEHIHAVVMLLLCVCALILAYMSWRFVERPFRKKAGENLFAMGHKRMVAFLSVPAVIAVSIAAYADLSDGINIRFHDWQNKILKFADYEYNLPYDNCIVSSHKQSRVRFHEKCDGEKDMVLWGNSHAVSLSVGMRNIFDNVAVYPICVADFSSGKPKNIFLDCNARYKAIIEKVSQNDPKIIVLHAFWSVYDDKTLQTDLDDVLNNLLQTTEAKIFVVGGVPVWRPSLLEVLIRHKIDLDKVENSLYLPVDLQETKKYDAAIQKIISMKNNKRIKFISLVDILCKDSLECISVLRGQEVEPLLYDASHLTKAGSDFVSKMLLPYLQ